MADLPRRPANRSRKPRLGLPEAVVTEAKTAGMSPLIFLLNQIRDRRVDPARRAELTAIAVRYLRGG
jgi:hypothetical protein